MIKEILHRIYDFEKLHHKKPIGIYLGFSDKLKLLEDSESRMYLQVMPVYMQHRWEINGVKVFFVDSDEHFNVG